jgi:outer membrane protein OmpA-like peptidoglycan-associated protein
MRESPFAGLQQSLDHGSVSDLAGFLGQSEQAVLRGIELSIAAIVARMASQSEDLSGLRKLLDLLPRDLGEISWPRLAGNVSNSDSLLTCTNNRIVSSLFCPSERAVANAIGEGSGLPPGAAQTLLTLAAPIVVGFLSKRAYEDELSMRALANLLQNESAALRDSLPSSLADFVSSNAGVTLSPVIAQSIQAQPGISHWAVPFGVYAAVLVSFWLLTHSRRANSEIGPAVGTTGGAGRLVSEDYGLIGRRAPSLNSESLLFEPGSDRLAPAAHQQVANVASILKTFPNVHLNIEGYTDNVGSAAQNLELSRARANAVKTELIAEGISPDRLDTEGFGSRNPIADNSKEDGRARNRRVAFEVSEK